MDYLIRVEKDGSITVSWRSPTPEDPQGRESAILDRDSLGSLTLSYMLDHVRAGTR